MKRIAILSATLCIFSGIVVLSLDFLFNPTAVRDPSKVETYIASTALRMLVSLRAKRESIPMAPTNLKASIQEGDTLYGEECGDCHGLDGRTPTDEGRWMYPRAADLTSTQVQRFSDRELFWIVKNGVRLSGMPAFAKVETDEHIWNLVDYLRTFSAKHQ